MQANPFSIDRIQNEWVNSVDDFHATRRSIAGRIVKAIVARERFK